MIKGQVIFIAIYVISDIHGEYDLFMKMLEKIKFQDTDTLYILGDILDRGPNPIQLLRRLMEMPNAIPIVGRVFLMESVKKSTERQKLILEADKVMVQSIKKYENDARVIVSKKRTFEAAAAYRQLRTVVHNFASGSNPGGGVVHGASAQEECLCRCSGLYFNLNVQPMWDDGDVITCAAPNLRENPSNGYNQGDGSARVIKLHEKTKCT